MTTLKQITTKPIIPNHVSCQNPNETKEVKITPAATARAIHKQGLGTLFKGCTEKQRSRRKMDKPITPNSSQS